MRVNVFDRKSVSIRGFFGRQLSARRAIFRSAYRFCLVRRTLPRLPAGGNFPDAVSLDQNGELLYLVAAASASTFFNRPSRGGAIEIAALHEDPADLLSVADIVKRIAVEQHEIGQLARLDCPE